MKKLKDLKVALVHDFLTQWGGAERVLEVLTEIFPDAPIYTLLYDQEKMRGKFKDKEIHTSFLQKFPKFLRKRHRYLLPFFPTAPETFDLRDFDLVISSSGAWSKGIVTKLNTIHFSYLHSPMRYAWDYSGKYTEEIGKNKLNFIIRPLLNYIRIWDRQAADRPDYLIANSVYTKKRIKKYYRRDSKVIYPPAFDSVRGVQNVENVESDNDNKLNKQSGKTSATIERKHFLVVSRLLPYKKVDLVVEAFNKLNLPLVIIGEGEQEKRLKSMAKNNIRFLGWQDRKTIQKYYSEARAFIFPAEDDFGITIVEAMSWGTPVIAYRGGGAKEIIEEGFSGEFFDAQTPEVLADGVRRFIERDGNYDEDYIKEKAKEFSKERFKRELVEYIDLEIGNQ